MDLDRVKLLLEYALLAAGQGDRFHNELGPIHLIKYVYLGDLVYAETNGGTTYTGIDWTFYHFGPWSAQLFEKIEPTMSALGAKVKQFNGPDGKDRVRYWMEDQHLLAIVDKKLPSSVALGVRRAVKEFGNDTAGLLHCVYKTAPMLHAAPGERLNFSWVSSAHPEQAPRSTTPLASEKVSVKEQRRQQQALEGLRAKIKDAFAKRKGRPAASPQPAPRYDEVFAEGQRWLDELAGEPLCEDRGELVVDDAVWKSPARTEPDAP